MSDQQSSNPKAFVPRNPGDTITAMDWNDMQIKAKNLIRSHDHTGDEHGTKLSGEAIKHDSQVTVKRLSVKNGFIMGFSPLFNETPENQDKKAVAVLSEKNVYPGTFLIAGPCIEDALSFRIYWKATEEKYHRFDIKDIGAPVGAIPELDSSGQKKIVP